MGFLPEKTEEEINEEIEEALLTEDEKADIF